MRLIEFFYFLRQSGLPVSVKEFMGLLEVLRKPIMPPTLEGFYAMARMALIKDESLYDRYDQAFGAFMKGQEPIMQQFKEIPMDWLIEDFKRSLTPEQKAAIEKHGWDKLLEMFKQRLEEQKERHAGGNKWIGTGGTSPFGHSGYHPEGIRVGGTGQNRSAVKVWEERKFSEYNDENELNNRNFKVALRKLRRFAREGAAEELDLDNTIRRTANNGGYLKLEFRPEKRNQVKVLMLFDTGGSMDDHIYEVERLFSAASSEFQHFEVYYFHNCIYERVWRYDAQGNRVPMATWDLINKYNAEWRLILVGDASMSPYEIIQAGGSVEHFNEESGQVWLQRLLDHWDKSVWLNPQFEDYWQYTHSIQMIRELISDRMYPVTVAGLTEGMKFLAK